MKYHEAVLLHDCIEALALKPNGTYVDVTFGGGGHSKEILKKLGEQAQLFAFDQDADAQQNMLDDSRFTLIQANFADLNRFLKFHRVSGIDGLLADLGVSSHQFDTPERGFSIRFDAQLDMRMNTLAGLSAERVVNNYSVDELERILKNYGELTNAHKAAKTLVEARSQHAIHTTFELMNACESVVVGNRMKFFAKLFQALRIEVNNELSALESLLVQSVEMLNQGGRLVVLSYHSLEDRLVKNFMKNGNFNDEPDKDEFGRSSVPLKLINKKVITPSIQEIKKNPRAASAKLRIAEKK